MHDSENVFLDKNHGPSFEVLSGKSVSVYSKTCHIKGVISDMDGII